jgi:hypothetical protein
MYDNSNIGRNHKGKGGVEGDNMTAQAVQQEILNQLGGGLT